MKRESGGGGGITDPSLAKEAKNNLGADFETVLWIQIH